MEVARSIASLRPEVIVLTTPHGLQNSWDWSFYGNSHLSGSAVVGRDLDASFGEKGWPQYQVPLTAPGAPVLAADLVKSLRSAGKNATLLKAWNDVLPLDLHWGEVLPLKLVADAMADKHLPPVVLLGLPLSRYNYSSTVVPGTLDLGRNLGHFLEQLTERVALVVSTDLAHRHWPNTSFGYSKDALVFDEAVGRWAADLDGDALMGDATLRNVDHIYSCGFLGLVLLHGALQATNANFTARLRAGPVAPTYYGMMSAEFIRRGQLAMTSLIV